MSLNTPLSKVRGLGSAKDGSHHWWMQRVTAIALIPLTIWFICGVLGTVGENYDTAVQWVQSPATSVFLLLAIVALFYHAKLGLQIVIEDYVHAEGLKIASLIVMKFAMITIGLACAVAVLRISLGAT